MILTITPKNNSLISKIKTVCTATDKNKRKYLQEIEKEDGWTPLESIEEFLITAMEGGSNYWYWLDENDKVRAEKWLEENGKRNAHVHYKFLDALFQNHDLTIRIYDCEEVLGMDESEYEKLILADGLEKIGELNMNILLKNLRMAKEEYQEAYSQHFPEYNGGDAYSADTLFQIAVLGKVIYG